MKHAVYMLRVHPKSHLLFAGYDKHTFHVLHNHAQMALGLKGAEHADYKGVLSKRQDISLNKCLLDLVPQN